MHLIAASQMEAHYGSHLARKQTCTHLLGHDDLVQGLRPFQLIVQCGILHYQSQDLGKPFNEY